ncbi:PREDICTED: UNC93-like protein MFSD11 [Amphimedon queenslandica]|uniref:UNC93-like protein MFSD11 n=1 Tax=Amphimedon queenslandica TaxID=400682 RepID=A0A1X7VUD4_AMPQE|nr:PREDICTED: UNC93-like protein MFSD11 [Amphimedon queenslandica]|eukprot:XP_019853557.1 PREDICTED: UNC93-like protein MFSD11 [Amphimedon queenslandica]
METKNWVNIILLGFGFFLLFSAFQTTAFIQTLTISSYLSPTCNPGNKTSYGVLSSSLADRVGYLSGSIIYLMVAIGNWVSVSIVSIFGAKWSLVISGALYVIYIACLIRPLIYSIFIGAFILGAGGGVLWTAQGQILIQNSSKERMGTTSGIFWFMLESSLVVGSIYIFSYYYIKRDSFSSSETFCFPHTQNMIIFGVLTFVAICGIVVLLFISPVEKMSTGSSVGSINSSSSREKEPLMSSRQSRTSVQVFSSSPDFIANCHPYVQAVLNPLIKAVKMMITWKMLLLCVTFVYTGYELGFWSGVYGTMIGHTHVFPKYYVGAALFFIGLGEIIGGGLFGVFGSYTNRFGRDPILLLGLICHMVCFLLTFYFFSEDSIAGDVKSSDSYGALGVYGLMSNIYVALGGAFLLGLGDACFNTQIYSIIGVIYSSDEDSAPAMALYKFFQSITAFVSFLTSTLLKLQWQLLILVVLAVLGTVTFCIVEWDYHRSEQKREDDLTNSYEEPNDTRYAVEKTYSASSLDGEDGFMSDSSAH